MKNSRVKCKNATGTCTWYGSSQYNYTLRSVTMSSHVKYRRDSLACKVQASGHALLMWTQWSYIYQWPCTFDVDSVVMYVSVVMYLYSWAHLLNTWPQFHLGWVHPLKSMASGPLKIKKGLVLYLYWPLGVTLLRVHIKGALNRTMV